MALNLDAMKAKLDKLNGKGDGKKNFWRPEDGESNIRIVSTKDGDPFIFSLPGWLGCCDLALYVLQMPFFFMGIFQVGGEEWAWVCYAGFLMLPHYLNDFFCCEFSNGCLCFPFWRGR